VCLLSDQNLRLFDVPTLQGHNLPECDGMITPKNYLGPKVLWRELKEELSAPSTWRNNKKAPILVAPHRDKLLNPRRLLTD